MRLGLGHGLDVGYRPELFGNLALLELYPGAAAAYSLRNIDGNTATNVVRVRRSSDNAEADFTAAEVINGTLTTWTGVNNGFVVTLYDQSGNANNATQATAAAQPQIVSSGSLITDNGMPAISLSGATHYLLSASASAFSAQIQNTMIMAGSFAVAINFAYSCGVQMGGGTRGLMLGSNSVGVQARYHYSDNSFDAINAGTLVDNTMALISGHMNATNSFLRLNGSQVGTAAADTFSAAANCYFIGAHPGILASVGTRKISEFIVYASDNSDLADIEAAINSHYSIY